MKVDFLGDNFLLFNRTAEKLYHDFARHCPIIDFHSHLPANELASDRKYKDLTEIWLEGDHYKWRAMRANGIDESLITGPTSNESKFKAWAATVPYTIRNPLYHWTHLELQRYFNISEQLNTQSASKIYGTANERMARPDFSARSLLEMMNVSVVCTSDDPTDTLDDHLAIKDSSFNTQVLPTWRPDPVLAINNPESYNGYIATLQKAANVNIASFQDLIEAIQTRHDYFHARGCRLADHGVDSFVYSEFTLSGLEKVFDKVRKGTTVGPEETKMFRSGMLHLLAEMNYEKKWVQQYHIGALRNTNPRAMKSLGPNSGYDTIGSSQRGEDLALFLGRLEGGHKLAKTILYNNNPADNYLFGSMIGNFQDSSCPGKMQYGASWWFLDQKEGIEMQLNTISNLGLLSRFVGMITDSRSFLSFPRHEYFRRILCNILGDEIEKGMIPNDMQFIGTMVEDICYRNAQNYFDFAKSSFDA